jgi:periplasmic divalent cation tolerance protein
LSGQVIEAVKSRHSYTNPALVVLPILGGSAEYLRWLQEETTANDREAG